MKNSAENLNKNGVDLMENVIQLLFFLLCLFVCLFVF